MDTQLDSIHGIPIQPEPVPHLRWEDIKTKLSPAEYIKFGEWMRGQTCMSGGVFVWDFERWLNQGQKNQQNLADWD